MINGHAASSLTGPGRRDTVVREAGREGRILHERSIATAIGFAKPWRSSGSELSSDPEVFFALEFAGEARARLAGDLPGRKIKSH